MLDSKDNLEMTGRWDLELAVPFFDFPPRLYLHAKSLASGALIVVSSMDSIHSALRTTFHLRPYP